MDEDLSIINTNTRNEMAPGTEGCFTKLYPEEKVLPIYDAVVEYKKEVPIQL